MKKLVCLVLFSLLLGIFFTTPNYASTLRVGIEQEAVGLDPNIVTAFASFRRIELLYNRLVTYNPSMKIIPDLAESWETPDNTTYIFHLRKGVKFHDGTELKAEDVKFTLERILDPKTGSPAKSYLKNVKSITILDPYTIKIVLDQPVASFLVGLASGNCSIIPKHTVEKLGNLQREENGTGPYKLSKWIPDNYMELVKNKTYFEKGKPYIDRLVYKVIPDQMSMYTALKGKSLDLAIIRSGSVLKLAEKDKDIVVVKVPGINVHTFGYNLKREPFNNLYVRQAIASVIDRKEIIKTAAFGFGKPTGPIPIAASYWAIPPDELPFGKPDPNKAKELLRKAGYENGLKFKILAANKYKLADIAQVIQAQLKKVGIQTQIEIVEWGMYVNRWKKRDYDAIVELRGGSPDPDRFLYRMIYSNGPVNNFFFSDKEIDRLLDKGRILTDPEERKKIYDKIQYLLSERAPIVFLYSPTVSVAHVKALKGFKLLPNESLLYVKDAKIEK